MVASPALMHDHDSTLHMLQDSPCDHRGKPPSRNPPIFPFLPSGCRRARSPQASGERLPSSTVIMSARHLLLATVFVLLALAAVESAKPKRKQVLHMRRGGPSRAAGRGAADARQCSVLLSLPALHCPPHDTPFSAAS